MIFIFAGTSEGKALAKCAEENRITARVYVATAEGRRILLPTEENSIEIVVGRRNEDEIKEELNRFHPAAVFDATHPYASEITANCRRASAAAGVRYVRVRREASLLQGDVTAADALQAADILWRECAGKRVLLTTGSKELSVFMAPETEAAEKAEAVFARILPGEENEARAIKAGILPSHLITGYGPFTEAENRAHLKKYRIEVLVTKESGKAGGYEEKLRAAKALGVKTIVIKRPEEPEGVSPEEAKMLLIGFKEELISEDLRKNKG